MDGLLATVGLVFVSYAGLTKVASVAEEIRDPDRNIPLGMLLSLGVATLAYTVCVTVMALVVPPSELHADLAPMADRRPPAGCSTTAGSPGLLLPERIHVVQRDHPVQRAARDPQHPGRTPLVASAA